MSTPGWNEPGRIVASLIALNRRREQALVATETKAKEIQSSAERRFAAESDQAQRQQAAENERIAGAFAGRQGAADAAYRAVRDEIEHEQKRAENRLARQMEEVTNRIEEEHRAGQFEASAAYQAARKELNDVVLAFQQRIEQSRAEANALREKVENALGECRLSRAIEADPAAAPTPAVGGADAHAALRERLSVADQFHSKILALWPLKILRNDRIFVVYVVAWLATAVIAGRFLNIWLTLGAATVASAALGSVFWQLLRLTALRSLAPLTPAFLQSLADVSGFARDFLHVAATEYEARRADLKGTRLAELQKVERAYHVDRQRAEERFRQTREENETSFPARLAAILEKRDREIADATLTRDREQAELKRKVSERAESLRASLEEGRRAAAVERRNGTASAWTDWRTRVVEIAAQAESLDEAGRSLAPDLNGRISDWRPAAQLPRGIRLGVFVIRMADLPGSRPVDPAFADDVPDEIVIPAVAPFPEGLSFVVRTNERFRAHADELLALTVLRLLLATPPGKIKFLFVDPVGLGRAFAGFMHLADIDKTLVTSRIWTEPSAIEDHLGELTGHMEAVIQTYLRNEHESLEAYNQLAGELAEPYRVLVSASFPARHTEAAVRRMASVLASGARCGVSALVSYDTSQPLPYGFSDNELAHGRPCIVWTEQGPHWPDPALEGIPFRPDPLPSAAFVTAAMERIGRAALEAGRVEVPFASIAPPEAERWRADSRAGITVAIGRSGARRPQLMSLGSGTSQHVLVAGKTGSGKSTLLHVLITNLCLTYSPSELELYLIDFKKGVEFKAYAARGLPHARVIAVESEREFGLSALKRLDEELAKRGEMFRAAGAASIAGFRDARPDVHCPRVLLIVDEFQEFFIEDDKTSQAAALLLDRLVRQGRAFGVHVLLGSQTLGGAYSLARSTLGQMAVRVALQCSEADAHLILSEENAAARLLARPGEAIYNDANGLVEGNSPFQVVWLSDKERDDNLGAVETLAESLPARPAPAVVFEGNVPADIRTNPRLAAILEGSAEGIKKWPLYAPLGEPVAITDPVAASFRAQGGANLLVLGQQEELALGILASAIIGLTLESASARGRAAKFTILDGLPRDDDASPLSRLMDRLGQGESVFDARRLNEALEPLSEELTRRQAENGPAGPPIFLIVAAAHRLRELRRNEDDYGFGRMGEEKKLTASERLAALLREGPVVGIFTILWADTLANLQRVIDRSTMREFDQRILMQMNAQDSSTLIDSPAASRLGPYRAFRQDESSGALEKFRPYAIPDDAYLQAAAAAVRSVEGVEAN